MLPVAHYIAAIVRFVGHHDYDCVPTHAPQAALDRATKSVWRPVLDQTGLGNPLAEQCNDVGCAIHATVIYNDDFVFYAVQPQL